MDVHEVYSRLKVDTIINAIGPATRLGGLPLHPEVVEAMVASLELPVRISELQRQAGRAVAEALGVPGAYVTAGASSALQLAAAVCLASDDPGRGDQLPHVPEGRPRRIVVQSAHRDPYDRALESAGAELITVGYPEGTHRSEVSRAVDERTVAILYRPWRHGNHVALPVLKEIGEEWDIPVIVDGALAGPPIPALKSLFSEGATVVATSGGKSLRGPQASGLLLGPADFIERAAVHHQDMDERESTWQSATGAPGPLRQGIGRQSKVGREQIVGLWTAVMRYAGDPGRDDQAGIAELGLLESALSRLVPEVEVERQWDHGLGTPMLVVGVGEAVDGVIRNLASASPRVMVGESLAWQGQLTLHSMALRPGDSEKIARALRHAISTL